MNTQRTEIASRILAGFAANPAVFAPNARHGWSLVNCTDEDIVGYSLSLADQLIEAENMVTAPRKSSANPRSPSRPVECENAALGDEG